MFTYSGFLIIMSALLCRIDGRKMFEGLRKLEGVKSKKINNQPIYVILSTSNTCEEIYRLVITSIGSGEMFDVFQKKTIDFRGSLKWQFLYMKLLYIKLFQI